jgi:hypothetical protein
LNRHSHSIIEGYLKTFIFTREESFYVGHGYFFNQYESKLKRFKKIKM